MEADKANFHRPATRGELRDKLSSGETCEVVTSNVTITSIMLRGWLNFDNFIVCPSTNAGWSLFKSIKKQEY